MSGHNPNKNFQSDELQDVAALLRGLPQVAAPMNFDAMLKARIAQAKQAQKADVTALLQELPRVAAPSDFDFKLRARIAQAKSEKTSPFGWLAEIFSGTFSWAQAGAATAAVALLVGFVAFQVMKPVPTPANLNVASGKSVPVVVESTTNKTIETVKEVAATDSAIKTSQPVAVVAVNKNAATVKAMSVKYAPPAPGIQTPAPAPKDNIEEIAATPEVPEDLIAANTVLIKHSSGETRVVKVSEVSFGLQSASLRSNSSREARENLELASAQIIY